MKQRFESKFEQTGGLFEEELVGEADIKNPEYQKELKITQEQEARAIKKEGYIRFWEALKLAKKFQPGDPTNPQKPFGRELRIALQDLLKLKTGEEMDRVRFYTAIGTPLDKIHGVDAFVEYEDLDKKLYHATFDFTTNPRKKVYKSDIVVLEKELPDSQLDSSGFLEKIEEYAKRTLSKMAVREVQEKKIILGKPGN